MFTSSMFTSSKIILGMYASTVLICAFYSSAGIKSTQTESDQPQPVFAKTTMNAQVGRVLDIKAVLPDGMNFSWAIPDQPGIDFRSAGLTGYLFPQSPGTYFVGIAYGNPIQHSWVTVIVGDGKIDKLPNPPPPQMPGGSLTLIVAFDKIPTLPPFSSYVPLTDTMLAKNHKWKLIDKEGKDSRGAALHPQLMNALSGKAVPYLLIVDGTTIRFSGPLPASGEEMLNALKTADGK